MFLLCVVFSTDDENGDDDYRKPEAADVQHEPLVRVVFRRVFGFGCGAWHAGARAGHQESLVVDAVWRAGQ